MAHAERKLFLDDVVAAPSAAKLMSASSGRTYGCSSDGCGSSSDTVCCSDSISCSSCTGNIDQMSAENSSCSENDGMKIVSIHSECITAKNDFGCDMRANGSNEYSCINHENLSKCCHGENESCSGSDNMISRTHGSSDQFSHCGQAINREVNRLNENISPRDKSNKEKGGHLLQMASFLRNELEQLRRSFLSPFGRRNIIYTDHTASSQALPCIEEFIFNQVLPMYANTHTTTSATGLQTTRFREEARNIIRNVTNASEHDVVLFCGSGVTGGINKLVQALHIRDRVLLGENIVVLHGPYEHHSNILPWRETGAVVYEIREYREGGVDMNHLEEVLKKCKVHGCNMIVGAFTAISNVTGIVIDVDAVTLLLRRYEALSIWDFATAAAYRPINMNPVSLSSDHTFASPDAIVFSPHKLLGGVNTPGVLIVKKRFFENQPPTEPGGGSVFFVSSSSHRYLKDTETREEAGTPDIVGCIRAGCTLKLINDIGAHYIFQHEQRLAQSALDRLCKHPNIHVLGLHDAKRVAIISFMIFFPPLKLYLHHNLVCCLLNDLFGIQARGGCACAGPYAQRLLGINSSLAERIEQLLVEDSRMNRAHLRRREEHGASEMLRPGFIRVNLPWFFDEDTIEFVLSAIEFVASHGWKLQTLYTLHLDTGEWRHTQHTLHKERVWISSLSFTNLAKKCGNSEEQRKFYQQPNKQAATFSEMLQIAKNSLLQAKRLASVYALRHCKLMNSEAEALRWFVYPQETAWHLLHGEQSASADDIQTFGSPFLVGHLEPLETNDIRFESNRHIELARTLNNVLWQLKRTSTIDQEETAKSSQQINPVQSQPANSTQYSERVDMPQKHPASTDNSGKLKQVNIQEADQTSQNHQRQIQSEAGKQSHKPAIKNLHNNKVVSEVCFNPSRTPISSSMVRFHCPPKSVMNPTFKALRQFDMLRDGDRVLVCISGGKDSLTLLHAMKQAQYVFKAKGIRFEIGAATVDPGTDAYDPKPLRAYMNALNVPYFYEEQCIIDTAANIDNLASICSFCSRMKRGRLYACARREGYSVLMFGQHLDDLAESFIMSLFHNGYLRTMKAHYTVQEGDLRMARPFVFVRERDIRQFAEHPTVALPIINENCPACFQEPTERHRVKQLLASQELIYPRLFGSLQAALVPLMSKSRTGMETRKLTASSGLFTQNGISHSTESSSPSS